MYARGELFGHGTGHWAAPATSKQTISVLEGRCQGAGRSRDRKKGGSRVSSF